MSRPLAIDLFGRIDPLLRRHSVPDGILITEAEMRLAKMAMVLQYVPHARVADFRRKGWCVCSALSRTAHGDYAILMGWPFPHNDPVLP